MAKHKRLRTKEKRFDLENSKTIWTIYSICLLTVMILSILPLYVIFYLLAGFFPILYNAGVIGPTLICFLIYLTIHILFVAPIMPPLYIINAESSETNDLDETIIFTIGEQHNDYII